GRYLPLSDAPLLGPATPPRRSACCRLRRGPNAPRDGNVVSCLHCMNDPQTEGHMASHIERRKFLATLGGAAAWPLAARAQQPERMRRIGVLMNLAADDPEALSRISAFLQGLQELGWTDGRNVRIDTRWGAGDAARFHRYAEELLALAPDVVLASGTPA